MIKEWSPEEEAAQLRQKFAHISNKAEFARDYKVPGGASMLSQHLSGHRPLSLAAASAYAKGFGVPLEEISPRLANEIAKATGQQKRQSNIEDGPQLKGKVPLISWVQAGEWCEALTPVDAADTERWMDCPVKHSPSTFVLRVRGDSMTAPLGNGRTYPEGCFIFVDPELRNPVNGERVIACLLNSGDSDVTFKVFKHEDGRRWLQPLNPSHEPIRDKFKIIGTVIGKWEDE